MEATHILDEQELVQRTDGMGRIYYTDLKNKRVATAGRTPARIRQEGEEEPIPPESDLAEIPFLGVAVAMAAILAGHGYHEAGGYCANRCGERAATLSLPQKDGGHLRYKVDFPETLRLALEKAD